MLENTNIWTHGPMNLFVNNEPAHVYVPKTNVKSTYDTLKSRLSKQGRIPIGIDHLADNILEANPILKKLDLHNVGYISEINYANDTIHIVEAELTNPLIKTLYDDGELEMVSIVANSTTSECPSDYDYIIDSTDITRVDIVEKGACPTCSIPKPSDGTVVYARYSIHEQEEEENNMSELTKEDIKAIFDESIDEKIAPMQEQINTLIKAGESKPPEDSDEKSEEVKEMEAKIAELQKETATAKVDSLIAAGKILPAQKEASVELCAKDATQFEALYKDAPVLIDLNTRKSLLAGNSNDDGEEDDDVVDMVNNAFKK